VISSGRPHGGIEGLAVPSDDRLAIGIYEARSAVTRLLVVNELPVGARTLLLRLLGAGSVLKQAIAELQPAGRGPERTLALPVLLRFR